MFYYTFECINFWYEQPYIAKTVKLAHRIMGILNNLDKNFVRTILERNAGQSATILEHNVAQSEHNVGQISVWERFCSWMTLTAGMLIEINRFYPDLLFISF